MPSAVSERQPGRGRALFFRLKSVQTSVVQSRKIAVVGAGGLGTAAAWGIVTSHAARASREAAPVPPPLLELSLFDSDFVELSNLNRQVLFSVEDIGLPKSHALRNSLRAGASQDELRIEAFHHRLTSETIAQDLAGCNFVVDTTDCVETKLLLNDYCVKHVLPYCYGGAVGLTGLVLRRLPGALAPQPCLRCLFGDFTEADYAAYGTACRRAGILGPVAGMIGFLQAEAVLDALFSPETAGADDSMLISFDMQSLRMRRIPVAPSADCPIQCTAVRSDVHQLDLTDKGCPLTYVYTKLALEKLSPGELLDVDLGSESSALNVGQSIVEDGHRLLSRTELPGRWRLSIQAARR